MLVLQLQTAALEGLEEATADFLRSSICGRVEELNLDAHQTTQAKVAATKATKPSVFALPTTNGADPRQDDLMGPIELDAVRLDSSGDIGERASCKMVNDGTLAERYPAVMLRHQLDTTLASRWEVRRLCRRLWDDYAKYVYLPRLRDIDVLLAAVETGPQQSAGNRKVRCAASA